MGFLFLSSGSSYRGSSVSSSSSSYGSSYGGSYGSGSGSSSSGYGGNYGNHYGGYHGNYGGSNKATYSKPIFRSAPLIGSSSGSRVYPGGGAAPFSSGLASKTGLLPFVLPFAAMLAIWPAATWLSHNVFSYPWKNPITI